jgi:hypothetical protein
MRQAIDRALQRCRAFRDGLLVAVTAETCGIIISIGYFLVSGLGQLSAYKNGRLKSIYFVRDVVDS